MHIGKVHKIMERNTAFSEFLAYQQTLRLAVSSQLHKGNSVFCSDDPRVFHLQNR